MLAHLRGASVKNTKKNSENAMRKPPMDDCGAKKAVSIPEEQIRPCRDKRNAAGQGAAGQAITVRPPAARLCCGR